MYGPTHFGEIISEINDRCENQENEGQNYQILLILTDGIINDMERTIDEIVRGSTQPLSIVIVGVGYDAFKGMEKLDADVVPLYSKRYKKFMSRDIVQFVPFRKFMKDDFALARETLEEIPGQLTDYYMSKGIKPLPAKVEDRKQIKRQQTASK